MILLDWSGVDLTPKSTPYAKKPAELQDSNAAPGQIYTINSRSWQRVGVWDQVKVSNSESSASFGAWQRASWPIRAASCAALPKSRSRVQRAGSVS